MPALKPAAARRGYRAASRFDARGHDRDGAVEEQRRLGAFGRQHEPRESRCMTKPPIWAMLDRHWVHYSKWQNSRVLPSLIDVT
jgi:hypothetical protein